MRGNVETVTVAEFWTSGRVAVEKLGNNGTEANLEHRIEALPESFSSYSQLQQSAADGAWRNL